MIQWAQKRGVIAMNTDKQIRIAIRMKEDEKKEFMDLCKDGTAVCQVAIGLLAVLAIGINWVKSRSAEEEEQGKYKKIRNEIVIGAIVAEVLIGGFFDTILSYFQ